MSGKLIMVLALAFGTSGAALAQTAPSTPAPDAGTGSSFTMPQGWDGAIGESLFSDPSTGTAHTQTDLTNNWANMTEEDQRTVREHCATLGGDAAATTGTGTSGGTGTAGDAATSGSIDGDGAHASIREICENIEGL